MKFKRFENNLKLELDAPVFLFRRDLIIAFIYHNCKYAECIFFVYFSYIYA